MEMGMIGLGRMGGNMVSRLLKAGHRMIAYDQSAEVVKSKAAEGAIGAATGWALAWPLTRILSRHFLALTLSPSVGLLLVAVAAGAGIAALAAQIPARLAASRDPTEVLHEA